VLNKKKYIILQLIILSRISKQFSVWAIPC